MKATRLYPSSLPYLELCPGFTNKDEVSTRAERGSKLHELVETANAEGADSGYEAGLVEFCERERDRLFRDFLSCTTSSADFAELKIRPNPKLKLPISSCKVDFHAVSPLPHRGGSKKILVIDYKFTMAGHDARSDVQGWTYALVLAEHYFPGVDGVQVQVAFIDAEKRTTSTHDFTVDSAFRGLCRTRIEAIYNRRRLHLAGIETIHTPGKHCRFCALFPKCRAVGAWAFPITENLAAVGKNSPIEDRLRVRPLIRDFVDAWTGEAKEAIVEGAIIPGFELQAANGRDRVGSMGKVLLGAGQWVAARNNTPEVVADSESKLASFEDGLAMICKPTKGELVKLVGKIFGKDNVDTLYSAFISSGAIVPGDAYEELVDTTNETKAQENA